ncbi:hypothetical protein BDR07DRAFT_1407472 [Suillus spraguei]|nr:hypothetical protein BDR07DRAFT_1407472 [Suillus spraguei]
MCLTVVVRCVHWHGAWTVTVCIASYGFTSCPFGLPRTSRSCGIVRESEEHDDQHVYSDSDDCHPFIYIYFR